jgi:hypothetical protein
MAESINLIVDQEWADFVSSGYNCDNSDDDYDYENKDENENNHNIEDNDIVNFDILTELTPKSGELYISTKTKISYLNIPIDLKKVFWEIPVVPYSLPCNGVIKKQIKFNSTTIEELNTIQEKLKNEIYFEEHIITSINNPTGRITFKDIRKVSIGISKKDLTSYRCKKKSAFYNCFVLILRMKVDDGYKEFHVKVFNTGKLEMPGVQNEALFNRLLLLIIDTLQPHIEEKLSYKENSTVTVLINSNFKCGFFINREALYDILRYKYNIQAIYDPCSYPGIQCKFYYNHDTATQTGSQISEDNKKLHSTISEVSFMIFRTGSVLIVGKCDEYVLIFIYDFLKDILFKEYKSICQKNSKESENMLIVKDKKKKIRKKNITVSIVEELAC